MQNIHIDDTVILTKLSNASLNLYAKAKQKGMSYVKCPCHIKNTSTGKVINIFANGFLLQYPGFTTVAHPYDLRRVTVHG